MMKYIKYANYISTYTTIMLLIIMAYGYLVGNVMLCNGLYALIKICTKACIKVLTTILKKLYEIDKRVEFIKVANKGLAI